MSSGLKKYFSNRSKTIHATTPALCDLVRTYMRLDWCIDAGVFIWLKPSLDKELVVPVGAYSLVIALMGMAAMTTNLSSPLVPLGAALFIASDVVLSIEKFKTKFSFDKTINWILYASGQIAFAIGVVFSLAL